MINKIFNPKTIAVIGATDRKGSVGRGVVENLTKEGKQKVFLVNPNRKKILKRKTYPRITDIKEKIDLALIVVPQKFVSSVADDCIEKKVKAIIIISSGFRESSKEGALLEEEISRKLKKANISLIGPNTLGVIRPPKKLNASFAPDTPSSGEMSFIFQSGGLVDALVDGSKYGFSFVVSVGNEAGLSFSDYIKMADNDVYTKAIGLYIEGLNNGRLFYETVKETKKPVVVLKAGKEEKAKKAISSHTGSLSGQHQIFSAAIKQAGAFEVDSFEELFDVVKALSWTDKITPQVGVVTNGGGAGVLLTDYLTKHHFKLPPLEQKNETVSNPYDILGDALSEKYKEACENALKQKNVSLLIVIQTPQIMTDSMSNAKIITELKKKYQKPIFTIFMGQGEETKKAIQYLEKNKIPNYHDPQRVLKPLLALINKKY